MEFILSDGNVKNSRGYRVNVSGIRLERFKANPVMLYEHDEKKVIGRWENLRVENNKLIGTPVFDTEDELGKEVARKVEKNFLRATSMGIVLLKMDEVGNEYVLTESELAEASIVSIPSDAGAVRLYNKQMEELSFDQVKLNFNVKNSNNNQKQEQMAEGVFKLSARTMEILKLDADYTPKDVELAVAEKDKEIAQLRANMQAQQKQAQTDYLNQAVKVGKITESERLGFEKLADKGCFDEVKAMIDAKAETATATLADKVTQSHLSAGREQWDYLKWMKEDPSGLSKLRRENPAAFERLQSTFKK